MVALSVASISGFATDTKPKAKAKAPVKCAMGGACCKKSCTKADMMKAKPAAAKSAVKKA